MTLSKSIVISLGSGSLQKGFPLVTAQLWESKDRLREQYIGSLPPAPHLIELYQNWQSIYINLCTRFQLRTLPQEEEDDELEILEEGVVNVSEISFEECSQRLQTSFNDWLRAEAFLNIDRQMRSQLNESDEIRLIIETSNELIRRLPWQCWDFLADYPKAEVALARSEYKYRDSQTIYRDKRGKVRILAILGDSHDINLAAESEFLASIADAEVEFLVNPSRQQFSDRLWDSLGWDLLFFAGHSQTERETGKIYLNNNSDNNSLTVEQLKEALKTAIANGLQLAIFNSCDGLGLALAIEKLNIPVAVVMREPISNYIAQVFLNNFLQSFALERQSLYLSVQQARRKLQGLEDEFPCASWLPILCHNPATEPPTWLHLGGTLPCPYQGLYAFREEDNDLFFGREQIVNDLTVAVKKKPLVAIVGASGSGKSSIAFAGLIPRLKSERTRFADPAIASFRPGKNPFQAMAIAIASFSKKSFDRQHVDKIKRSSVREFFGNSNFGIEFPKNTINFSQQELEITLRNDCSALKKLVDNLVNQNLDTPIVLIIDQFEELYTLSPEKERQPFLDVLLQAITNTANFTLVITLRADFYGHAIAYRPFSDALQGAVYNLGAMNREELQLVIEAPATQMQIKLEKGLTELLILEMKGHSGSLPLLEFALTQLWSRQKKGILTHQAYQAIGGLGEALANHAEAVYAGLSDRERFRMQRIFVQLVRWGEETEVTRRLATREEVKPENWQLVTHLASSRLVVTNRNESTKEETLEIVHEALIKSWGRLESWLVCDRDFRKWQERLRGAMDTWKICDCDPEALLYGKQLVEAEEWSQQRFEDLSKAEQVFIGLSLKRRDARLKQKQKQIITLRLLLGLTSVAFLLAAGLSLITFKESQRATESQIEAIATSSESLFTLDRKLDALVRAIEAKQLLQKLGKVDEKLKSHVNILLAQTIYGADEYNRLLGTDAIAFSHDGNFIATNRIAAIEIWKKNGTLWKTLFENNSRIWSLAFSPDRNLLASAHDDKTVKLWIDGKLLSTLEGHRGIVREVVFSPNGRFLATASDDKTVKLWNLNGKLISTLEGHNNGVLGIAFSPDGRVLASASSDKTIKLWNQKGKLLNTLYGHRDEVRSVAFSPDGRLIASASSDKTIKLWQRDDTGEFAESQTFEGHTAVVSKVAFSPDGRTIASASWDTTVRLWSLEGALLDNFKGHTQRVWDLAFSPDGKTLASASNSEMKVRLWSLQNPESNTFIDHKAAVIQAVFSPDGKTIASGSDDGTIKLWRSNGTLIETLKGHTAGVLGVAFSGDSQILASASWDNTVKLWQRDLTSGSYVMFRTLEGHRNGVWKVIFSGDDRFIASASEDGTVKLWTKNGELLRTLKSRSDTVKSISISPDSKVIAVAGSDGTVGLWNLKGRLLTTFKGHNQFVSTVSFSPDGRLIVSGGFDNTIQLRKSDGTLLKTLKNHQAEVKYLAFSPDGKLFASASSDKTIKLWKRDGTEITTIKGHANGVWSVAFSPDGQKLISASEDGTVKLWNLSLTMHPEDLLAKGCNWVRDYLQHSPDVNTSDRHLCDRIDR
jgi:WD40 repeat protein/energy-coupling factor transporter ATP-binding protein EcfA2